MVVAGFIALAGIAVTVVSLGWLHLQPTGLSPMRNAVSQYGITPFRSGYRVATLGFGAAGAALAVGIARALTRDMTSTVVLSLCAFAAARGAISWFPMDTPGTPRSEHGRRHGVLALIAFAGATFAAFRLGDLIGHPGTWHALSPVSTGCGVTMLALLVGMALSRTHPGLRMRFGLVERGFYLVALGWFTLFAVACAARIS